MSAPRDGFLPDGSIAFHPLPAPAGSRVDFGAECSPGDVSALSDTAFASLERAVLEHHVVIVRGQATLSPKHQYELTRRFDPTVETYGHGNRADLLAKSVLVQDLIPIPAVPQVKVLGHGAIADHEGVANAQLRHPSHRTFHKNVLSDAEEAADQTRFYRWHIDAALYGLNPPRATTLLALRVPEARRQTVRYDDGSGDTLDVSLGATAFVSGYRAFELLTPERQAWARRTSARYAPHPYIWIRQAKARADGLGIVDEGLELSRAELPPIDDASIVTLPLVWKNRHTGRLALMVHPCCVEELITDGEAPMTDLRQVRKTLHDLQRPAIAPDLVFAHEWRTGDLAIFDNHGVWHSVVGSLRPSDARVYHQCNLASSTPPLSAMAATA